MSNELEKEYIEKLKQRRSKLRNENTKNLKRPSSKELSKLISNLKQCAAYPKKFVNINEKNYEQLLRDSTQLNLTRYIEETIQYLTSESNKIEDNDIPLLIDICSLLHQRYIEFSELIAPKLAEILLTATKTLSLEKKDSIFSHQRRNFHLLIEFFIVGIFDDWNIIYDCIKNIIKNDNIKNDGSLHSLMLIAHLSKLGSEEILGVYKNGEQLVNSEDQLIQPANQKKMKTFIGKYFEFISSFLVKEYKSLKNKEKDLKEQLESKGVIHSKVQEGYNERQQKFEKLLNAVNSLAEPLQLEIPKMVEEKPPEDPKSTIVLNTNQNNEELGIWDDKETQDFYENLPDLTTVIPLVLLRLDKSQKNSTPTSTPKSKSKQETPKTEVKPPLGENPPTPTSKITEEIKMDPITLGELEDGEKKEEVEEVKSSMGENSVSFVSLLNNLQNCNSREMVDKATIDFCYVNTKKSRKSLVEELYRVPKNKLELIPYYSRMVATLNQYFPKLAERLLERLINEFYHLAKMTDVNTSNLTAERKNKNIKFLSELTKFKVCPSDKTFYFFQLCFENYSLPNIEMVCIFLENCGRYLFKSNDTHVRTKLNLETLLRLKKVHNIRGNLELMIDNAYYQCNPPTISAIRTKQRPPMQLYIRHLLYKKIQSNNIPHIVTQLRKVNWKEHGHYIIKSLYKVGKLKFNQIQFVSQIISHLSPYHPLHCLLFLDNLLENLQLFLENSSKQNNQQSQLMNIKLIAHLYLSNFFDSQLLFSILYAIIEFGVSNAYATQDSFRVRMVCVLLEIIASSLNTNSLKKILNLYLLYFQRYVLSLNYVSLDLQFQVNDLFSLLEKFRLLTFRPFTSLTLLSQYLQSQISSILPIPVKNGNPLPTQNSSEKQDIPVSNEQPKELSEEELQKLEIEKKEEEIRLKKVQKVEEKKKKEEYEKMQKELFENELKMLVSNSLEERKKQDLKSGPKERSLMIPLSLLKDLEEEKLGSSPSDKDSPLSSTKEVDLFDFPSFKPKSVLKKNSGTTKKSPLQSEKDRQEGEEELNEIGSEEDIDDDNEENTSNSSEESNEDENATKTSPKKKTKPSEKKVPAKTMETPIKAQKFRLLVRPTRGNQKAQAKPLFIPNDSDLVVKHNLQKQVQINEKNELAKLVMASANRIGQDDQDLDYSYVNPSKPQRRGNFYEDYDPNDFTSNDN
eukprot:TRINITY_DN1003_c0_g1_i1.p1 TRINITY_DN1003_c0_g1~~TRINITY_DN1003_c0_g1_i1.p1  ORF type:complete len:1191 (+),score=426.85 TRINITY_DN1003_c0_g1_i1:21-3593(+)